MQLPDSPALLSMDVGNTTWQFWYFDSHFWGRPDKGAPDFVACFLDFDGMLNRLWKRDEPHQLRERLRLIVQNEGFFRAVVLGDDTRILLHRWQPFVFSSSGELARFWARGPRWSKTVWLLETPAADLRIALERERKRRESDLGRALDWLALPPKERVFAGLQWTTGNAEDLKRLINAAFWRCDELWDGTRDTYDYALFAQPGREFLAESGVRDPSAPRHFRPLPPNWCACFPKLWRVTNPSGLSVSNSTEVLAAAPWHNGKRDAWASSRSW